MLIGILEKEQKKGNATTEKKILHSFTLIINHIYSSGITTPMIPKTAPDCTTAQGF